MRYDELHRRIAPRYGSREAQAIVRLVLESRFGMSLTDILCGGVERLTETERYVNPSATPTEDNSAAVELERIMSRLEAGEPVQYVLGEAEFFGRKYHIEPGALIPRPETEDLCEWIISETSSNPIGNSSRSAAESDIANRQLRPYDSPLRILDIGTGSGCIAITLALAIANARVTAWDISEDALRIARRNADMMGAEVDFRLHDALDNYEGDERWDIIVSNPPYICHSERQEMDAHVVDHEPSAALFVPDDDPLVFYRHIAGNAPKMMHPGGALYFETHSRYHNEVVEMLKDMHFRHINSLSDRFDRPRFVRARGV